MISQEQHNVRQRLDALAKLQKIDSALDRIRMIRGGLPEEVRDLEDELEGLKVRLERIQGEVDKMQREISVRYDVIRENQDMKQKYEKQLMNVKNSREFDAVNKEIELADLEVLTAERKIKQFRIQEEQVQNKLDEVRLTYNERKNDLDEKNKELEVLVEETRMEEDKLLAESKAFSTNIDARLLKAYTRIRENTRNGLAVVTMDRGACGGCFAIIPPQRQFEIRELKKIIICENCGRILVDESLFDENKITEVEAGMTR